MNRFYIPSFRRSLYTITDEKRIHQMRKVLRLSVGDEISLFSEHETESVFIIEKLSKHSCELRFVRDEKSIREPLQKICLGVAFPHKLSTFETILQKSVETGVSSLYFFTSQRSGIEIPWKERFDSILIESLEQSGRVSLPVLTYTTFKQWCEEQESWSLAESFSLDHPLLSNVHPKTIAIGPEGGFSQEEVEFSKSHGGVPVSLGKTILRMDTACVVAVSRVL